MAQRLTFRNKANDIAWQKQLRDNYSKEPSPPVPHLKVKKAIVKPVTRLQAEQIILKYEWLGTMVKSSYHYGVFFGMFCAGVCCIAYGGGGVHMHKEWNLERHDIGYLARGANTHWSPKGANSKLVSWSSRLFHKHTNAKMMIAYSDTDAGEIGTIYQACNWACVGRGASTEQWVSPQGRIYDMKLPYDLARKHNFAYDRAYFATKLKSDGWATQKTNPKYRYVYVLDKNDKQLIDIVESKRVPYPKRKTCG